MATEVELIAHNTATGEDFLLDGLPVMVLDDDFIDFIREEGYEDSIELVDFYFLYEEWEKEACN